MKVVVLGSGAGGLRYYKYGNTQLFLDGGAPDKSLLFDCGASTGMNIGRCNFDVSRIDHIYLTHAHDDHLGGLPGMAIEFYFNPMHHGRRPNLWGRREILNRVWPEFLGFQLETLAEHQLRPGKTKPNFDDFFIANKLGHNKEFHIGNWICKPIQSMHVMNGGDVMDSFGLKIIDEKGRNILITGDTQFAPEQLKGLYEISDEIIHDCETLGTIEKPFRSSVHSHLADLITLPERTRGKMHLIHYNNNMTPELAKEIVEKYGFKSVLFQGQEIEI